MKTQTIVTVCLAAGVMVAVLAASSTAFCADAHQVAASSPTDMLQILAQDGDSGSNVRVTGRSIKGIIYLGIAVVAGIGWVIKKIMGKSE